jgi:hypothetical protein
VNKMKALITETVGKAPIRPCIESKTTEHWTHYPTIVCFLETPEQNQKKL